MIVNHIYRSVICINHTYYFFSSRSKLSFPVCFVQFRFAPSRNGQTYDIATCSTVVEFLHAVRGTTRHTSRQTHLSVSDAQSLTFNERVVVGHVRLLPFYAAVSFVSGSLLRPNFCPFPSLCLPVQRHSSSSFTYFLSSFGRPFPGIGRAALGLVLGLQTNSPSSVLTLI